MILASDGVFEFISSQKAVDICCGNAKSAMKATKALIALSTFKWAQEEGDYRDDITAIVVFLPDLLDSLVSDESFRSRSPSAMRAPKP